MAGILTDVGAQEMLNVLFGATAKQTSFSVQLFTDSTAIADSDTNTTHTVASGGGYASQTITNNATVALSGGIPTATWGAVTFAFTGVITAGAVRGYQVLSGTTLLFLEQLPTPYTPLVNGDSLIITPKFALGNGTPA